MINITITGEIPADLIATICELGEHESAAFEQAAIDFLQARGKKVMPGSDWETPSELCKRLGIYPQEFSRQMRHPKCPPPLEVVRPNKRIIYLRSHPALDQYLTRFKKPHLSKS